MQASLVIMTILGCNDSVSQCQYIATAEQRWVSVELCNRDTENVLAQFSNVNFPSVVGFCQQQAVKPAESTTTTADGTTVKPAPVPESEKRSLAARAIQKVAQVLPGKADIKMVFATPLHVVTDSYAWAAKKLTK
ncbi:hypothetical protein [Allorhizobium taibaishanense]|uniref:Uncharacterized protein n=1 Tax=Allorhizobium taibaishanense TaxID=887144 RepID=A0A1Q9A1D2_9HYPH|nr:hypothetical protein [Allorhizobium taibaishanense]MBB4008033.1 hypothetical protein [Allorhizobium taibaishanense]OLP48339.1 hypothetical protein BJF91_09460 [Allorhizobium taibaishanense]